MKEKILNKQIKNKQNLKPKPKPIYHDLNPENNYAEKDLEKLWVIIQDN